MTLIWSFFLVIFGTYRLRQKKELSIPLFLWFALKTPMVFMGVHLSASIGQQS